MPVFEKVKIKYKAERAIAIGEEIEVVGSGDVPQDQFDALLKPRLDREDQKLQQVVTKNTELAAELEALKKKAGNDPGNEDKAAIAKLAADLKATQDQLAQRSHQDKVRAAIEKHGAALPNIYKDAVKPKLDATDEEIQAAVTAQMDSYKAYRKEMGLPEDPTEKAAPANTDAGFRGSGPPANPKPGAGAAALEQVKAVPSLFKTLAHYDEATQQSVALKWVQEGKLQEVQAATKTAAV